VLNLVGESVLDAIQNSVAAAFIAPTSSQKCRRLVSIVRLEGAERTVILNALNRVHKYAGDLTSLFIRFNGHPPHLQFTCAINETQNLLASLDLAVAICLNDDWHRRKCLVVFPPTDNYLIWEYDRRARKGGYYVRGMDAFSGESVVDGEDLMIGTDRLYAELNRL